MVRQQRNYIKHFARKLRKIVKMSYTTKTFLTLFIIMIILIFGTYLSAKRLVNESGEGFFYVLTPILICVAINVLLMTIVMI